MFVCFAYFSLLAPCGFTTILIIYLSSPPSGGDYEDRGFSGGNRGRRGGRNDRQPRLDLEGITKTLFVRNLPFSLDEYGLKSAFAGAQVGVLVIFTHKCSTNKILQFKEK